MSSFLHRLAPRRAETLLPTAPLRALADAGPLPADHLPDVPPVPEPAAREAVVPAPGGPLSNSLPIPGDMQQAAVLRHTDTPSGDSTAIHMPKAEHPARESRHAVVEPAVRATPFSSHPPAGGAGIVGVHAPLPAPASAFHPAPTSSLRLAPSPAAPASVVPATPPAHTATLLSPTTIARIDPEQGQPPPPAIHISIDRIEIRAAPASVRATPTPKRKAGDAQGLRDYLQGKRAP